MGILKRRLVAPLMILFIFATGFIINVTEVCAERLIEENDKVMNYFPRSVGNTWNYVGLDEEGKSHRSTRAIIGKEKVVGEQRFVIENKIDGVMYEKLWVDNGATSIKGYKREQLESPGEVITEQYIFYPPILLFVTLPSAIGNSQITNSTVEFYAIKEDKIIEKGWNTMTFSSTAVNKESVVTPAGTFNGCIKFERKIKAGEGDEMVQYIWLAPGVGQVKFTLGNIEFQLSSYNLN